MAVSDYHSEYLCHIDQVRTVRDAVAGSAAVKSRHSSGSLSAATSALAGTMYLPTLSDSGDTDTLIRYQRYRDRAIFTNFTGATKDGLLGMVFRRPVETYFPTGLEYLEENMDGTGLTADQFCRDSIGEVLETGRLGLLVDYPRNSAETLKETADLRAYLSIYTAENITNWYSEVINGKTMLSVVILKECSTVFDKENFEFEDVTLYRVLMLDQGKYKQAIYDDSDTLLDLFMPTDASGAPFDHIPFYFIGAQNNDCTWDKSPLYDIAEVNIGHYRNSADYEDSCHLAGQPTPWLSGLSQAWVDEVLKGGITLGSRSAVLLPESGSAGLIQAAPNQMPLEAMKIKEEQMIKIGARIIMDSKGRGDETAEAARIRFAGQNSKLAHLVGNVESGINQAVADIGLFMGVSGYSEGEDEYVEINKDFYDKHSDPQMLMAQIQLLDRGVIAMSDLREALRRSGVIEREDDEIDEEVDSNPPMSVGPVKNNMLPKENESNSNPVY